ncbi:MAG: hypothetical protein AAFY15_10435, partial [Cyanobacteria bacterium J06648_11]
EASQADLTTRDLVALEVLAHWVRALSLEQLGVLLSPTSKDKSSAASRWLKRMAASGLVDEYTSTASEPQSMRVFYRCQLSSKESSSLVPDFRALSAQLRRRWMSHPKFTRVVRLGRAAASMLGVPQPRRMRPSEASHDLQLAAVALSLRDRGVVTSWEAEESLARREVFKAVTPDALVTLDSGQQWVVEGGGSSYSAAKLEAFHRALLPQLASAGLEGYLLV